MSRQPFQCVRYFAPCSLGTLDARKLKKTTTLNVHFFITLVFLTSQIYSLDEYFALLSTLFIDYYRKFSKCWWKAELSENCEHLIVTIFYCNMSIVSFSYQSYPNTTRNFYLVHIIGFVSDCVFFRQKFFI